MLHYIKCLLFICLYFQLLFQTFSCHSTKIVLLIHLIGPPNKLDNEVLKSLKMELGKKYANKELDGFCLYL